jgi:hypothetical protein
MEVMFARNVDLAFNRLHGIISKQIEVFITTGVTTSSPKLVSL